MKIQKILIFKITKYITIGGISTLIHFFTASLYIYLIKNSIFISNIIGFLTAYGFSYTMQSKLVFEHQITIKKALKYFIVQFGALILSILIADILRYNIYIKIMAVTILLPLITFLIHKFWTFREKYEPI